MADDPAVDVHHDLSNEQVVIAAALADEDTCERLITLPADLFLADDHIEIWSTLRDLHRQHLKIDVAAAARALSGKVEPEYLRDLLDAYPAPPANLGHHIANLRWDACRAEVVTGPLSDLLRVLSDPTATQERVCALASAVSRTLNSGADREHYIRSTDSLIRDHMTEVAKRRERAIYPFGIEGFDDDGRGAPLMVPGVAPGKVTVITGVSGSAKSVLTARIMLNQARFGRRCLFGAWEMGGGETLELMAIMSLADEEIENGNPAGKWTRRKVSTGQLSDDETEELRERMEAIAQYVRFFEIPYKGRRHKINNDDCLDVIHQVMADYAAEVTALDLWERAIPNRSPEAEANALFRTQEIADVTGSHMLIVGQQRLKEVEQRDDPRPTREGIKGSSAWVEVGDTIIGTHREALFTNTPDIEISLLILKQRWGRWPCEVRCDWDGNRGQFLNGRVVDFEQAPGAGKKGIKRFTKGGRG